jgi:cation diffusion facilitator family transporter
VLFLCSFYWLNRILKGIIEVIIVFQGVFAMLNYFIKKISEKNQAKSHTWLGIFAGCLGLVSNLLLFIAKMIIGVLSGSVSIQADAINNLSDTASSIMTLIGFKAASKPADKEHPYGHERFEYISGFVVSILVTYVGFQFLHSSIKKIINPELIKLSPIVFIVLILSIVIKIWQGAMYKKIAKEIKSNTLLATAQDSLNDVFTTVAVVVSAAVQWLTGWKIDGFIGLFLALYILFNGIQMIRSFIAELLGMRPDEAEITKIQEVLNSFTEIIGYHDLLIHSYGPHNTFASVHIEVDDQWSLNHAHLVIDRIEQTVKQELEIELVCHLDPYPLDDPDFQVMTPKLTAAFKAVDEDLRIHDIQVQRTPDLLVHFDVVVPTQVKKTNQELTSLFLAQVQLDPVFDGWQFDITYDRNYLL